jgi:hypothetical protein
VWPGVLANPDCCAVRKRNGSGGIAITNNNLRGMARRDKEDV